MPLLPLPLDRDQENLLYEIYGITRADDTVIDSGDYGLAITPMPIWSNASLQDRLAAAILKINSDHAMTRRVAKIVKEYECLALDPSQIERNGYSFRYNRSVNELKKRLYTYTGIVPANGNANAVRLG
jgi:hypothetical protein